MPTLNVPTVFLVNLERRKDRLEEFNNQVPFDNPITRVVAVDGQQPLPQSSIRFHNRLAPAQKAIILSHSIIYNVMIKTGCPYAVIFEDDAVFQPGFVDIFNNYIQRLDYDVLYLGYKLGTIIYPNWESPPTFSWIVIGKHSYRKIIWLTHAYVITNRAARYILGYLYQNEVCEPLDVALNTVYDNSDLRVQLCSNVVAQSNSPSDIPIPDLEITPGMRDATQSLAHQLHLDGYIYIL